MTTLRQNGAILIEDDNIENIGNFGDAEYTIVAYESLREIAMFLLEHNINKSLDELCDSIADKRVKETFKLKHTQITYEAYHKALTVSRPEIQRNYMDYFNRNSLDAIVVPTTLMVTIFK